MTTFPNRGTPVGQQPRRPSPTESFPEPKASLSRRFALALTALALVAMPAKAATYKEQGGRVVIEAEHFDTRTANADGHVWQIMPDEIGNPNTPADTGWANAR